MTMNEITTTARNYREIQAMIKELELEAETLKQAMIREMDSRKAEELIAGMHRIKYTVYESQRIDTTSLKKHVPEIAEQFTKKTTATRFQVI